MINHALTSRGKNRTTRFVLKQRVNRITEVTKILLVSQWVQKCQKTLDNSIRIKGESKENKIVYYIMEITLKR